LTVDNGRAYVMPDAMTVRQIQLQDSQLYVGGVAAAVDLHRPVTPVHNSLAGGFTSIVINGRSVTRSRQLLWLVTLNEDYGINNNLTLY